jgi:hypothetical protein
MAKKNKRVAHEAVSAPAAQATFPLWRRRFFPAVFFLLLSLIYFY